MSIEVQAFDEGWIHGKNAGFEEGIRFTLKKTLFAVRDIPGFVEIFEKAVAQILALKLSEQEYKGEIIGINNGDD